MSLQDFLVETRERYHTQDPVTATRRTAVAFRNGAFRHLGRHLGRPVWTRSDWDVLVVLDACRTDIWRDVAPEYNLPHENSVWSNASCSIDWINRTFNHHPDRSRFAGYVTANPFADHDTQSARSADLTDSPIGYFQPLYKTHWQELAGGQIATVTPETVTDHAIQTWRNRRAHDINRLVVHYMQPHEPYRSRPEWASGDHKLLSNLVDSDQAAGSSIWPQLEDGEIDREEFMDVYRDNLRWVLDDVTERLLPNLEGEVVLTSDHGNALGEWGEWHHPPGAIGPAVRRVPWSTIECTDEQTITPDMETMGVEADVEDQLEALGYK